MALKKRPKAKSLTATLALTFLALSLTVLLLSTAMDLISGLKTQQEAIVNKQHFIAEQAANTVKIFVQEKYRTLSDATHLTHMAAATLPQKKLALESLLGIEEAFRQLYIFDSNGNELVSVSRLSKLLQRKIPQVYRDAFFAQTRQQKNYMSDVFIDPVTSEPMVLLATPMIDVLGDLKGTLVAEANLKFMWDLVSEIEVGENGLAYVIDANGRLLAFRDISLVLRGEGMLTLTAINRYLMPHENAASDERQSLNISKGILGNYVVTALASLGTPDWTVAIELPVLEAYAAIVQDIKISVLSMFIVFALAIFVGIYLSRRITRPIIELRDATTRIGQGHLDTQIVVSIDNEIGELARSFNQMVQDLKQTTVSRDALADEVAIRKMTELALNRAKQEAEKASLAKTEFLTNMSHEIRTPMNSIIGMTELAIELTTSKEQKEYLRIAASAADGLLDLINDILDFSKIEVGQVHLEQIPFNVQDVVESVCDILSVRCETKGLDLIGFVDPRLNTDVVGDPTRLRQVLLNLGGNAVKFTKKGEVCIKVTPAVTSNASNDGVAMHFEIIDTGIGMLRRAQRTVFEKFTQADNSTTRLYGGTGLGLSITKSLVEMMGGHIDVKSKKNAGSTFFFTVTLPPADLPEVVVATKTLFDFSEHNALLIDNNKTRRELLAQTLEAWGLNVTTAANTREAAQLRTEQRSKLDIILVDYQITDLPNNTIRDIIKQKSGSHPPQIIAFSNIGAVGSKPDLDLKITHSIAKPVKQSRLLQVLRQSLANTHKGDADALLVSQQESLPSAHRDRKILLVEDNEDNQRLATTILRKAGYQVEVAENGLRAIDAVKTMEYDVILMDVQMPVMDGFQATQEIRIYERQSNRPRTPIIALTAHAFQDYRQKCLQNDMDDYTTKPVKKKPLLQIIQNWLDKKQVACRVQ